MPFGYVPASSNGAGATHSIRKLQIGDLHLCFTFHGAPDTSADEVSLGPVGPGAGVSSI